MQGSSTEPPVSAAATSGRRQRVWGGGDDWKETVRRNSAKNQAWTNPRGMWSQNQELAKQHNRPLHPIQFAKMIVDQSFASLIG